MMRRNVLCTLEHDDTSIARGEDGGARYVQAADRKGGGGGFEASASNHVLRSPNIDRISNRRSSLGASSLWRLVVASPSFAANSPSTFLYCLMRLNNSLKHNQASPSSTKQRAPSIKRSLVFSSGLRDVQQFAVSKRRAVVPAVPSPPCHRT